MAMIYLTIITLTVSGLNGPIIKGWLNETNKSINILPTRNSELKKHTDWKQGNRNMILHINGKEKKARAKIGKKIEGKHTYVRHDRIKTKAQGQALKT